MKNTSRFLIFFLFVTSLFPSILYSKIWGYSPAFAVLFITFIFTLSELRDNQYRRESKLFVTDNKLLVVIVLLYVIITSASTCMIGTLSDSAYVVGNAIIIGVLLLFISISVREKGSFIFLLKLLFLIGVVNSVIALILYLLKWSHGLSLGIFPTGQFIDSKLEVLQKMNVPYVLKGLFWHPNFLGMLLAFAFPAGLFLAHEAKSLRNRVLCISGLALFLITMACAFAFISFVPVCMALTLFPIIRMRLIFNLVRVFIVAIVFAINIIVVKGYDLAFLKSLPITSRVRVDLWNHAISVIREHPLFGVGASNTANHLSFGLSAHNTFIAIALGNGIFAMIIYSAFLLTLLGRIRLTEDVYLSTYMILTFLTFFVLQLFETQILGGMSIANFYFLLMMLAYLSISVKRIIKC
jgi:O-antigen ligase